MADIIITTRGIKYMYVTSMIDNLPSPCTAVSVIYIYTSARNIIQYLHSSAHCWRRPTLPRYPAFFLVNHPLTS